MKLEVKEVFLVNGVEYSSLHEARSAQNRTIDASPESAQKVLNFAMIPIYERDVSEITFYKKIFENVSLMDIIEIRQSLSNSDHRFVLPTYSEIKSMEKINRFPYGLPRGEYWTSTRFLYNTYISYEYGKNKYNDIYPQYRRNAFFFIKENKPESWFRDPPIPNSIDEMIYLKEKENNNFIYSF